MKPWNCCSKNMVVSSKARNATMESTTYVKPT